jgi:hypothetical protein
MGVSMDHDRASMIIVNVNRSGARAVSDEQVREAAVGAWVLSETSEQLFGDYLLAVRKNIVVGAWAIEDSTRDVEGKVTFEVSAAPEVNDMVGQASPVEWKQGQANPVKLVDTRTLRQEASEVELTPQGNRRVQLDGWSLIVYADGRARLQSPDTDRKLIVESAFPGPKGANVTVRLLDPVGLSELRLPGAH